MCHENCAAEMSGPRLHTANFVISISTHAVIGGHHPNMPHCVCAVNKGITPACMTVCIIPTNIIMCAITQASFHHAPLCVQLIRHHPNMHHYVCTYKDIVLGSPQHASLCVQSLRASSQQSSQCVCAVNKGLMPTYVSVCVHLQRHHPNMHHCVHAQLTRASSQYA